MALNRDKFRRIVGGITTATEPEEAPPEESSPPIAKGETLQSPQQPAGQSMDSGNDSGQGDQQRAGDTRRFAKRGRPKGRKDEVTTNKTHKIKVSRFLDEKLIND
jgi:hypothetical protein